MISQQPTDEQWFWEQIFGEDNLDYIPLGAIGRKIWAWVKWEGKGQPPVDVIDGRIGVPLSIDLNSLFEYAVPAVREKLRDEYLGFSDLIMTWVGDILSGKDPADSLYQIIYKAFGGKDGS